MSSMIGHLAKSPIKGRIEELQSPQVLQDAKDEERDSSS
jgi:hypothetical protein